MTSHLKSSSDDITMGMGDNGTTRNTMSLRNGRMSLYEVAMQQGLLPRMAACDILRRLGYASSKFAEQTREKHKL